MDISKPMKSASLLAVMMPFASTALTSSTPSSSSSRVHCSLVVCATEPKELAAFLVSERRFASDASAMSCSTSSTFSFSNASVSVRERFVCRIAVNPTVMANATTTPVSMRACKMRAMLRWPGGVTSGWRRMSIATSEDSITERPTQQVIGMAHAFVTSNARTGSSGFVTNTSMRCSTSTTTPVANENDRLGICRSNMNLRNTAAYTPAKIVPRLHATRVNSPTPHATAIQRSTPPMTPAMMPAGPPNSKPATKGAASRTFIMAPFTGMPASVP